VSNWTNSNDSPSPLNGVLILQWAAFPKFLEKHFARTLQEEELDQIMGDFPKPNCLVLCTPKLDEEVKRLIGTEKALLKVQDQILNLVGPLTCLWSDLLNQQPDTTSEQVILLIQKVLILLGSASHSIKEERQRVAWARVNPKSTPPEDTERKQKEQHSLVEGFWKKLPSGWKKRRLLQRLRGTHIAINQHANVANWTVTQMIPDVFWRRAPLQGTEAGFRGALSHTTDYQSLPNHSGHTQEARTRTLVSSSRTDSGDNIHTQIL